VVIAFDFEGLGTDPEDRASPNALYASATWGGHSVTWDGSMVAQNSTGSTVEGSVDFDTTRRAILSEYLLETNRSQTSVQISPPVDRRFIRLQLDHMNGFDVKFFASDGSVVASMSADLSAFATWITYDSGQFSVPAGKQVSLMTIGPPASNAGRSFFDNITITLSN